MTKVQCSGCGEAIWPGQIYYRLGNIALHTKRSCQIEYCEKKEIETLKKRRKQQ